MELLLKDQQWSKHLHQARLASTKDTLDLELAEKFQTELEHTTSTCSKNLKTQLVLETSPKWLEVANSHSQEKLTSLALTPMCKSSEARESEFNELKKVNSLTMP